MLINLIYNDIFLIDIEISKNKIIHHHFQKFQKEN